MTQTVAQAQAALKSLQARAKASNGGGLVADLIDILLAGAPEPEPAQEPPTTKQPDPKEAT